MNAIITLDGFDVIESEQAHFTITSAEYGALGTITIDFGDTQAAHKVTMDFPHPYMVHTLQAAALVQASAMLDSQFSDSVDPYTEAVVDLL